MTGQTISHFRVSEKLGGGGMGVVYLADDLELKRKVALKFLPPHLSADEEANQRFVQEAQSASALNHPNVCTIHEIGHTEPAPGKPGDGQTFIAMAHYEGETLKAKLASGPLATEEAADVARQVAEGLAAAHEQGIVHRDIKPANIFITRRGRAVILDFGLAKLTGSLDLTKSGSTLGTAHYMSPEQIRSEEVDHRTDLWSLGVVLYEMLAGKRPFEGDYEQAISYAILNEEPERLRDQTAFVEGIVHSCLKKNVAERTENAATLAKRLQTITATTTEGVATLSSASKMPWIVTSAVILVFVVVALLLTRTDVSDVRQANATRGLAVFPFNVAGDSELEYLAEGMVDLLGTALDGAGDLRAVDSYRVIGEVHRSDQDPHDPTEASVLSEKVGASTFVIGSILRIGDAIRIAAAYYDASGEVISRANTQVGSDEELLVAVDRLAQELVAATIMEADEGRLSLAVKTTSSISALKAYLRGEKAIRLGRFEEAVREMQSAVEEDSSFALAWYRMSDAIRWVDGQGHLGSEQVLKAASMIDRLPIRARRFVRAEASSLHDDIQAALEEYETLTAEYPRDAHAWMKLGDMLWHRGPRAGLSLVRAKSPLERALVLEPTQTEALFHLIELAISEGRFATADSLIPLYPEEGKRREFSLRASLGRTRDETRRDSLIYIAMQEYPNRLGIFGHHTRGRSTVGGSFTPDEYDLAEGETIYKTLFDQDESNSAYVFRRLYRTGRWQDALPHFSRPNPSWPDQLLEVSVMLATGPFRALMRDQLPELRNQVLKEYPLSADGFVGLYEGQAEVFRSFLVGLLSIELDDWPAVEQQAAFLESRVQLHGRPSISDGFATTLKAYIEWNKGNRDQVKRLLADVRIPFLPSGSWWGGRLFDRQLNALILMEEGQFERALEIWESLVQTHAVYTVPSYLYRGRCLEGLGDSDRAIAYYQTFADLWKDADPELQPMVEEARAGLERLLDAEVREPS